MNRKNIIKVFCAIFSTLTIAWYLFIDEFILKHINYYWIRVSIFFLIPIIFTFISTVLKCKLLKDPNNNMDSIIENFLDLFNITSIYFNIYFLSYFICSKLNTSGIDFILNLIILLLVLNCLHIIIKKLMKITYSSTIILFSIITLLGWFNLRELLLISILSIILNTIISIDDRLSFISFLERKGIGNKFIWNQNIEGKLTSDELKGKFIAQKIIIYILITVIYMIMKVTENKYYILYIYSKIINETICSYPGLVKYLYRGVDRLLIFIIISLVVYFNKTTRCILKKIFQPEESL